MPLTQYVHKAMLNVDGESIISGLIKQLRKKIPVISVTVGYKGEELARHVIEEQVAAVYNTNNKSECWWLFNTPMRFINEPVLVFACDLVTNINLNFLYEAFRQASAAACLLIPVHPVAGVAGDYITGRDSVVTGLSRSLETDVLCSGIFIINPYQVNQLMREQESMQHVWNELLKTGSLHYSDYYPEKWDTVNTIEQLAGVQKNRTAPLHADIL